MWFSEKTLLPQVSWGPVTPRRRQRCFQGGESRGLLQNPWHPGCRAQRSQRQFLTPPLCPSSAILPSGCFPPPLPLSWVPGDNFPIFPSQLPWGLPLLSFLWCPHPWVGRNDLALVHHLSADSVFLAEYCSYWFICSDLVIHNHVGVFVPCIYWRQAVSPLFIF